jgi:hypothetical protein
VHASLAQNTGDAGAAIEDASAREDARSLGADAAVIDAPRDAAPTCEPRPKTIDFEHLPDGAAACSDCPITNELSCWGVTFSFESSVSNGTNRPTWCQWQGPTTNTPGNTPTHTITNGSLSAVPPGFPDPANPLANNDSGTIIMTFSSTPVRVIFTAIVNNAITLTAANITASGIGGTPNLTIASGTPYTPSGSGVTFRQDTITVATANGSIGSIRVNAQGFTALIDDMTIAP